MGRASWLIATVLVAGCIHDDLIHCEGGWLCASELVCDQTHHICVTPDQLTACDGHVEGDTCMAGAIFGVCRDGVCIEPQCGNRVVEPPDEMCDDGNHDAGDGCSPDCRSDERCGNGYRDRGESCDDGNLYDKDGCDSRCSAESVVWDVIGINPWTYGSSTVWDPERRVMVQWAHGVLWEMGTGGWKAVSVAGPRLSSGAIYFDADQHQVTLIGASTTASGVDTVARWNGASWSIATMPSAWPADGIRIATWDPVHHRVIAIGMHPSFTLGEWNGTDWVEHPFPVATSANLIPPGVAMAYDSGMDQAMILADQSAVGGGTFIFAGGTVTGPFALPSGVPAGWGLIYDAQRQAVLAIGGSSSSGGTYYDTVFQWTTGVGWVQITTSGTRPSPRARPRVGYDPATHDVIVAGGIRYPQSEDVFHLSTSNAWTTVSTFDVPPYVAISMVSRPDGLVISDTGGKLWHESNGSWTQLPTTTTPFKSYVLVYDPARAVTYAFWNGSAEPIHVAFLTGTTWVPHPDGPMPTGTPPIVATYDPLRRAAIVVADATYTFDGTTWQQIAAAPPAASGFASLAYEASTGSILYVDAQTSSAQELDATGWHPVLSPGMWYCASGSQRRGSVLFASQTDGAPVYERTGTTWTQHDPAPVAGSSTRATTDIRDDALVVYGQDNFGSTVALLRRYVGSGPAETCIAGEDADGDGLVDCADADCWLSCNPACPFGTSCP